MPEEGFRHVENQPKGDVFFEIEDEVLGNQVGITNARVPSPVRPGGM